MKPLFIMKNKLHAFSLIPPFILSSVQVKPCFEPFEMGDKNDYGRVASHTNETIHFTSTLAIIREGILFPTTFSTLVFISSKPFAPTSVQVQGRCHIQGMVKKSQPEILLVNLHIYMLNMFTNSSYLPT